jgi:hypothetical protein
VGRRRTGRFVSSVGCRRTGRFGSRVGRRRSRRDGRGERDARRAFGPGPGGSPEIETRRRGRERGATEGERETERDRRGMDDGSPGLREKWEREGENEREGGKWGEMKPGCFCRPSRNSNFFFFFLGDVEGATSARDGRWTDASMLAALLRMTSSSISCVPGLPTLGQDPKSRNYPSSKTISLSRPPSGDLPFASYSIAPISLLTFSILSSLSLREFCFLRYKRKCNSLLQP